MIKIDMSIFGEMLFSRPQGREAFLGASAYLFNGINPDEEIVLDFVGVKVLAPSWADEFITHLKEKHKGNISFINTENPSVSASLSMVLCPVDVTKFKQLSLDE